jgi:hypothetical protein
MTRPGMTATPRPSGRGRHSQPRRHSWWLLVWALLVVLLLAVIGEVAFGGQAKPTAERTRIVTATVPGAPTVASTAASTASSTASPTVEPTRLAAGSASPSPNSRTSTSTRSTWAAGTYAVGSQIPPGTYHSAGDGGYCAWLRLNALRGDQSTIIAYGVSKGGPLTATVEPTDKGFEVQGNCTFSRS